MKLMDLEWTEEAQFETDIMHRACIDGHRFTVLDRLTGFGWRDIETGYRDPDGKFWLASGMFDVRKVHPTVEEAIELIKKNANSCIGD